jgi:molybdopterin-guanine dinucleotide biosynthesis protein A
VLDVVTPLFSHVLINSNQPALYREWDVPVIPDMLPNKGALGGIYTALQAAPTIYVFCVACDMPFFNSDLLQAMVVQSEAYDALVPCLPDGLHPLHAIYSKHCLSSIETLLRQNRLKISGFFPLVNIRYLNTEDIQPFDPHFESFINLNTWEDVEKARKKLESGKKAESRR